MLNNCIKVIPKDMLTKHEQTLVDKAKSCLNAQTLEWHINSPKRVSACIYIGNGSYIVGQNIGISKITGTLCAERAAVATAVSLNPNLQMSNISDLFVLGEENPLLPCGVCCEWLYKINPQMSIYCLKDEKHFIRVKLFNLYADEQTILNKR